MDPRVETGRCGEYRTYALTPPRLSAAVYAAQRGTIALMVSHDEQLERLLGPNYLDGLQQRTLDEVRSMRTECQEAETAVSYLRRMAQGRLDIVHAYLDREGDDSISDLDSLIEQLPEIISAGPQRPAGPGRLPSHMSPAMDDELVAEVDKVLNADAIADLPVMSREALMDLARRLSEIESRSSSERRALHERIDKLQAEIVSRYKTGEASVEGLLA